MFETYNALQPTKREVGTWRLLQKFPKPLVIGLDRRFVAQRTIPRSERVHENQRPRETPIDGVKSTATTNYARYRNEVIALNSRLKDKIILSAFHVGNPAEKSKFPPSLNLQDVERLENRVKHYFTQDVGSPEKLARNQLRRAVKRYFQVYRERWRRRPAEAASQLETEAQALQFQQVHSLLDNFEQFDTEAKKASALIEMYLDAVNGFLKDSGKEIFFKEDTNALQFSILGQNNMKTGSRSAPRRKKARDVAQLSSGEQQILILLTYTAFGERRVFIIDEPELSLHPKWQEEFVAIAEKFIVANGAQLIMATHSPAIVGQHTKYCQVLTPYNH